jgi:DNA-directed RNA polymerase specialized sigma subunit
MTGHGPPSKDKAKIAELQAEVSRWKQRAEEAEAILRHNMALSNATARKAMGERNKIICSLREKYSAVEIAGMAGLTRQRVYQILNEAEEP